MIIYKATNIINGKVYIGQTITSLENRKGQHERSYKYKHSKEFIFARAIKKYGTGNFKWEIIDTAITQEELNLKEIYWIQQLNSLVDFGEGYNCSAGGFGGAHSENTKMKIGQAQIGQKNHMFGIKGRNNPSSKKVMNITDNKCYDSATECAEIEGLSMSKICAVCRGDRATTGKKVFRYLDDLGNPIEPRNQKHKQKHKEIINLTTGHHFLSISEATDSLGLKSRSQLSRLLIDGKRIYFLGGYVWCYGDFEISTIEELPTRPVRRDAKKLLNITTSKTYPSISSVGKNYRNLATALRKGNGKCHWNKEEWEIIS